MPKSDISWAVEEYITNLDIYETCDNYYGGDHPLLFATEKFRNTFGTMFQTLADNLCPAVVHAECDRLFVTGWDGDAATDAADLWKDGKLARTFRTAVRNASMKGDGYIVVGTSDNAKVKAQFWSHDPEHIVVMYDEDDEPGTIIQAARIWTHQDGYYRLNLYYEDAVEMYRTKSDKPTGVPDKETAWIAAGTGGRDNNLGVIPIFHFARDADLGDMGTSILKDVIPLQNALNKSVCDMLVAGEFVAYPQRWATGLQVEVDEDTGKPKNPPFTPGVDRIWTAAGEVKFGQFQTGDLKGFLDQQDSLRREIARVSGVPTHLLYLETAWPSGEALKTSEGRLVKMVEAQQTNYDDAALRMMQLGLNIIGKAKGIGGVDADVMPVWANPSPHNPLLDAETQMVKQQVGTSKKQSLRELGYEDTKIKEMMAENDEEAQKSAALAPAVLAGGMDPNKPTPFTRNGSPGQPSKPAPQQQQGKVPVPTPRVGSKNDGWSE